MCVTLVRECLLLKNKHSKHPYRQQESWSDGISEKEVKLTFLFLFHQQMICSRRCMEEEKHPWSGRRGDGQDCVLLREDLRFAPNQRGFVLSRRMPGAVSLWSTEELSVRASCALFNKIH